MNGWCGKILKINLTTGERGSECPPPEVYRENLGGRGMAGYYLFPEVTRPWDDPEMPLLLFTGPLVDTPAPTSGRMTFMSRSPLTGTVGDCSVGGSFGTLLKKAGWDGIVVTGRAPRPCGIEIDGDRVAVTDATALVGLPVGEIFARLKGKGGAAVTGPAAESGVAFANLVVDGHFAAGRNGLGLAFAAKQLKYVTVSGQGKTAIADSEELADAVEDIRRLLAASPAIFGEFGIAEFGTPALYDLTHARRMMPTANFRRTLFPAAPALNAPALRERYRPKKTGCRGCPILCKKMGADGTPLPEFESLSHFTALLENEDLDLAVQANRLCNDLGMDTISAAATLACHAEIEGVRLSPAEILSLLEAIGRGRGIGAELGRGSAAYAGARGRVECAIVVKGQELPAYDPRGAYGMALAYATSTRGGCHLRAYPISHEILRKPVATDRMSFSGKARIIRIAEDMNAAIDSLTTCKFIFFAASLEEYARALRAVTGMPVSAQDLLRIGERIVYRERMMNAANGFAAAADDLPERFFRSPGTSGGHIAVPPLDRAAFLEARGRYYAVRGLDAQGLPTLAKAKELGLPWTR
ncbi:MAG: aldehyde ferredoxin oxidoreductase [Deltaproteobacteria bacterium]|nr:aldehyde ferredoxin oxidoreductase [Deltaproteobacteria bacterium]